MSETERAAVISQHKPWKPEILMGWSAATAIRAKRHGHIENPRLSTDVHSRTWPAPE